MRPSFTLLLALHMALACADTDPVADEQAAVLDEATLEVESAGLLARVAISPEQARTIALELTDGGTIVEAELEEEGNLLLYSFEVRDADGSVLEVEVDAMTGEVLDGEAEDDEDDDDEGEHER